MGKSAPKPPPAPDYAAAAQQQGQANLTAANQGAVLSNPNIISPYGNQTVTWGAADPNLPGGGQQATVRQTLTPAAQAALDAQQRVQLGESNLASQGLDKASGLLSQGFQYRGPGMQTSLGASPNVNYGPDAPQRSDINYGPGTSMGSMIDFGKAPDAGGIDRGPSADQYGLARGIDARSYGQALSRADTSDVARMPVNAGQTGQQAILNRLNPQIEQTRAATEQRLANQGIRAGSEAYNNEMRTQNQGFNDLQSQAALQGIGLDMSANQQGFSQAQQNAGLYNSALAQNFGQGLQGQALNNSAVGQNFGQAATATQLHNDAQKQLFDQQQQQTGTNNAAQQQLYGQGLNSAQAHNAAQNQLFNQQGAQAGLYNTAQNQQFNQGLQGAQFGNTAQQADWAQQLAQYNLPLNQIAALMSGGQIQNPQFQAYSGQNVGAAPVFQGVQAQNQYNQDIYGQQMAARNAQFGALGSAAGAVGAAFAGSDYRLKSNIERVGEHPLGIGVYEYDIEGRHERGVMAHELMLVKPEAVAIRGDGYFMVDYAQLEAA